MKGADMKLLLSISLLLVMMSSSVQAMAKPPGGEGSDQGFSFLLMIITFMAIFYFIVIRPQQREQKEHQKRIKTLKKGDRIITSGGIHGTVCAARDKTLVVEIDKGVKVTLTRTSVSAILEDAARKESEEVGPEE
jgi:preprotein translocase subunit YajC